MVRPSGKKNVNVWRHSQKKCSILEMDSFGSYYSGHNSSSLYRLYDNSTNKQGTNETVTSHGGPILVNYDNIEVFIMVWTVSIVVSIVFAAVTGFWYHYSNRKRAEKRNYEPPIKKVPSTRSLEQNCQSTETLE